MDITREILIDAKINGAIKATRITSCNHSESAMVGEEVGGANKSVDSFCNENGAKKPYLVDVNREEGLRSLRLVRIRLVQAVLVRRRICDG
ncbi:hypothetical protein OAB00_01645 [Akkermansiaceae bacterium]|nr:hypothetical protein [Akkermansiaceae bacterium]